MHVLHADERSEVEALRAQVFMARNHNAELEAQLAMAKGMLEELRERLTLSDRERKVLDGEGDGCIRISELRPILRRVFPEAA